jgi:hypothetical protein
MPSRKYAARRKRKASRRRRSTKRRRRAVRNKRIGGYMGFERKYLDDGVDNATIDTVASTGTGFLKAINVPDQGSGASERDGRAANMLSVHVQGELHWSQDPDDVDVAAPVRVFLLLDTQNNATTMAAHNMAEVFELTHATATIPDALAFRNLEHTSRYKILADKTYYPPSLAMWDATKGHIGIKRVFEIHKPLGFQTHYNATSGTDSNIITDNALFLCALQVTADATPRAVVMNALTRLRFSG